MLKKIGLIIVIGLSLSTSVFGMEAKTAEPSNGRYQSCLLQGIQKSFNLDEDGADALLRKAAELEPDNPMAYALQAMLHLFAYEMCFTLEQRRKEKEAIFFYTGEALARGEKRLFANPRDSQAYFAVALAKIARVHWAISEKRYLVMAQETFNVWNSLEAAKSADPANYDADYLTGFLRYTIDHFRGVTGWLSSLLITQGNRQKGLQELQTAAQKGILMRDMAQIQLAGIYLAYEKQPARSLAIIEPLRKKYPDNYSFHFMQGLALMELRRFAEAQAVAEEIRERISAGKPPYVRELEPRYFLLAGRIAQKKKEYDRAGAFYQKAMADSSFYNVRNAARALLYLGTLADLRRDRKTALECYNRVANMQGADAGARLEAQRYGKSPYRENGE